MMIVFNMRVHVHIGEAPRPRVLADGGRVGRASERGGECRDVQCDGVVLY